MRSVEAAQRGTRVRERGVQRDLRTAAFRIGDQVRAGGVGTVWVERHAHVAGIGSQRGVDAVNEGCFHGAALRVDFCIVGSVCDAGG